MGKGRKKRAFKTLELQLRADFAAKQAEVAFRAKSVMEEQLKQNGQDSLFYDMEMPLLFVLADMEH